MLHRAPRTSLPSGRRLGPGSLVASLALLMLLALLPSYAAPASAEDPAPEDPAPLILTSAYDEEVASIGGPYRYEVRFDQALSALHVVVRVRPVESDGTLGDEILVFQDDPVLHEDAMSAEMNFHSATRFLDSERTFAFLVTPSGTTVGGDAVTGPEVELRWTDDTTVDVGIRSVTPEFYPELDGRQDTALVALLVREDLGFLRLHLVDPAGRVAAGADVGRVHRRAGIHRFRVRLAARALRRVESGTYYWRAEVADNYGHRAVVREPIEVHAGKVGWIPARVKISGARSVIDTSIGRCSRLMNRKGTLRYLSQTRCRVGNESQVIALQGARIPQAIGKRYRRLEIETWGGRENRRGYLVSFVVDKSGKYRQRTVMRGPINRVVAQHRLRLKVAKPRSYVRYDDRGPYVVWSTGLTDGARYRVKQFVVTVEYWDWTGEGPIPSR
ncbi:MAG: hypothetical protein CMH83_07995 [Nocardioides sp.]|nr:hypothetical protein [Nocardioides sp.]